MRTRVSQRLKRTITDVTAIKCPGRAPGCPLAALGTYLAAVLMQRVVHQHGHLDVPWSHKSAFLRYGGGHMSAPRASPTGPKQREAAMRAAGLGGFGCDGARAREGRLKNGCGLAPPRGSVSL
jgi:hypothetical protein